MNYYRITLQYDGTNYHGWQIQPDVDTVQGNLNRALYKICKTESGIRSMGSGRTDAGVHALAQVVKIDIPLDLEIQAIARALNANMPSDIRCVDCQKTSDKFMPTVDAKWKEYVYLFSNNKSSNCFQDRFCPNYPHPLDFELMQQAVKILIGSHDFCNYFCVGTEVNSTEREIFSAAIEIEESTDLFIGQMIPRHYKFVIRGEGFLKQMVRLIMGAIWNVGRKKVTIQQFQDSLSAPMIDHKLGATAPASGLFLSKVSYPK